jgi:endogenous inhibitor of DNA gyrase (YacG/DUF329 family)
MVDLGNWAEERYRVAGDSVSEEDLDPSDDPEQH